MEEKGHSSCSELLEIINAINSISESEIKFNTQQCKFLIGRCSIVKEYAKVWIACTETEPPCLAMAELVFIIRKALELLNNCCAQHWLRVAAFRLNNCREFARICCKLSKSTATVNAQLIHSTGDSSSETFKCLLELPHKYRLLDDLCLATEALHHHTEQDKQDLLHQASSVCQYDDSYALATYLICKLQARGLPLVEPLELKNIIGRGAFGCVFKAEWLGSSVAVKEFRKDDASFQKEVGILDELIEPDPNVLQMIGHYYHDSKAYLVMEIMEEDLASVIRRSKDSFKLVSAVDIMLQIANGMCYLHEKNVVHRDLKPQNILVNTERSITGTRFDVRLADFGFSRTNFTSFAPDLSYQRGTLFYMAPEMFKGQTYSREVDVYSFGVTSFQILTGSLPFQGHHLGGKKLLEMIEAGNRPDLPLDCPKELVVLINKCWNTNPKDRLSFERISMLLSTLKEKLLVGHNLRRYRFHSPTAADDPGTTDTLGLTVIDLLDRILMAAPAVNFHQCNFLQSRCMKISSYIQVWSQLKPRSLPATLRRLVPALRSALSLVESCCGEDALRQILLKQHNPIAFRKLLEAIDLCVQILNSEADVGSSIADDGLENIGQHATRLEQYAAEDKLELVEIAKETILVCTLNKSISKKQADLETKTKIAEYLLMKLTDTDQFVPYIKPDEITLVDLIGMTGHGPVFKANWLGIPVILKNLGSEGEQILRDVERRQAQLDHNLQCLHPNIAQILGYSTRGDQLFIIAEFASRRLYERDSLNAKPLAPLLAVEVMIQLAQGVYHLHTYNVEHGDIRTGNILVEFEQCASEPGGYTGNITVKVEMDASTAKVVDGHPRVMDLKTLDAYMFGATCFEILTGHATGEDILQSGKLDLPRGCPVMLRHLIEKCLSQEPPEFLHICESLKSVTLELGQDRGQGLAELDYRGMLLSMSEQSNFQITGLQIVGNMVVGEKLLVVGNTGSGQNRLYQWVRHHRNGAVERLQPFLVTDSYWQTLEYILNADDYNKAISLTYVDMNERIEVASRTEITNGRWVACRDNMKHAIKDAWIRGEARFKVRLQEGQKKGYLMITCSHYVLSWKQTFLFSKEIKTRFSATVSIKISSEESLLCHLINNNGTIDVRFVDAPARDLAVLTLRHFMTKDSF